MLTFEEMPEDNADLARVVVDFPRLEPDTADSCPVPMAEVLGYLRLESPDGDSLRTASLEFLRTALVSDCRFWIWSFHESDGAQCFVTASVAADGTSSVGYDPNIYGLTPEQFILGDFHEVF
jgi:hypothetical protein